jgi:pimeloyl-ACP methyl ester carboxylesterase
MRTRALKWRGLPSMAFGLMMLLMGLPVDSQPPTALPVGAAPKEQASLREELKALETRLDALRRRGGVGVARWADAELFAKGAAWALRYEPDLTPADLSLIQSALARGRQRIAALESGERPWEQKRGRLTRGYVSAVDGSVQPYGLIVPESYDPGKPTRLDVVLHGSTRPVGMSELRFIAPFDEGDRGGKQVAERSYIELHPLGRVENCYRWAGESDVFEAIEDVCRCYHIDRDRIVLRGMSMGASGTWHLGLKHPDLFVALGPYCGYVDTHRFSETPGMNFVKVGPLPAHQEKALHMLDSVDYAANAGIVPAIAAIGERDPFFQAHVIMGAAMQKEGLQMVNLISPGTAHVQDPAIFGEQMRRIGVYAEKGRDRAPRHIRFVTWTLKYARCHGIELLGLREHYRRAELEATAGEDGVIRVNAPLNVTRFAILPPMLQGPTARLMVGGQEVRLPRRRSGDTTRGIVLERRGARWVAAGSRETVRLTGKRPGLQGPIDDAFTSPFLCVRGTGRPWNPAVQAWAEANLRRFAYEWNRYFRGELPVKDDTEVTPDDCRRCNLILFGDPGSNLWIRKALPALPIRWTRAAWQIGPHRYPAADHAPALICPSPFNEKGVSAHYLVLNSGHTFHEAELNRLNYLLFPRLGDWAVFKVGGSQPESPSAPLQEEVVQAGFWNEQWRYAREEGRGKREEKEKANANTTTCRATVDTCSLPSSLLSLPL